MNVITPRDLENRELEREIIGYVELPKNSSLWTGSKRYFSWALERINEADIEDLYFFTDRLTDKEVKLITKNLAEEDAQGVKPAV